MNREELLDFMAGVLGVNPLDKLAQGIDDPNFDPEKPYRGKLKFEDLPESTRMVIELGEYAQTMANFYADYQRQECFIQTSTRSHTGS